MDEKSNDTMNTCSWCDDPVSMGVLLGQPCLKDFGSGDFEMDAGDFDGCNQHGNLSRHQSLYIYIEIDVFTYMNTGGDLST